MKRDNYVAIKMFLNSIYYKGIQIKKKGKLYLAWPLFWIRYTHISVGVNKKNMEATSGLQCWLPNVAINKCGNQCKEPQMPPSCVCAAPRRQVTLNLGFPVDWWRQLLRGCNGDCSYPCQALRIDLALSSWQRSLWSLSLPPLITLSGKHCSKSTPVLWSQCKGLVDGNKLDLQELSTSDEVEQTAYFIDIVLFWDSLMVD